MLLTTASWRAIACHLAGAALALTPALSVLAQTTSGGQDEPPDRLGERLIRKAVTDTDEDMMTELLRLMSNAARRLSVEFDPGTTTQREQEQIIQRLDEAIQQAAANRRQQNQPTSSSSDKRRMQQPRQSTDANKSRQQQQPAAGEGQETTPVPGGVTQTGTESETLLDPRRGWGNLPQRDRDELIQGSEEGFLERYRDWIERYYRALQESDE